VENDDLNQQLTQKTKDNEQLIKAFDEYIKTHIMQLECNLKQQKEAHFN